MCFFSLRFIVEFSFAKIFNAYIASLADLFIPTVTTGEPVGISEIDNNESNPPNAENLLVSDFFCLFIVVN